MGNSRTKNADIKPIDSFRKAVKRLGVRLSKVDTVNLARNLILLLWRSARAVRDTTIDSSKMLTNFIGRSREFFSGARNEDDVEASFGCSHTCRRPGRPLAPCILSTNPFSPAFFANISGHLIPVSERLYDHCDECQGRFGVLLASD